MTNHIRAADETKGYEQPEKRLAMAIIINAISEAMGNGAVNERTSGGREKCRESALRWFVEADADFQAICDWADLDPNAVRSAALAHIQTGVRMPRRQAIDSQSNSKRRKDITIARIAAHAGVSATSVRNALDGRASHVMQARVQSAIKTMGKPANDR
ncbi:hypothetical protein [Sphingobium sp. KCTC 72723]|uniref:hypothetical protein n=1 Tax=Sphingobium sp. KCTC 72723 TaxID=2733867 RepID=UPI00165DF4E8|nr:hypothetical protein [Sphingobium sp. KCTC 72723]